MLSSARDNRCGPFCLPQGKLDSGSLYRLLQSKDAPPHPAAKFIWETRAPPRVQFFIWLMVHGKVQRRTNLFRKTIVDSPICEVCRLSDETDEHIALQCPFAEVFWEKLGIQSITNNDCIFDLRACLVPKIFCAVPITSNLAAHAWSTKCRRKKTNYTVG